MRNRIAHPSTRLITVLIAIAAVFAAFVMNVTSASADTGETQTVSYGGVSVVVPQDWPVLDVAGKTGCVRYDQPAVYLGTPAASDCPSTVVGHGVTVQLLASGAAPVGPTSTLPSGALLTGGTATSPDLTVTDPDSAAQVLITSGSDTSQARDLAATVRFGAATSSAPAPSAPSAQRQAITPYSADAQPNAAAPLASSAAGPAGPYTGPGFDACTAPSASQMQAWLSSPYRGIGVYVGGANMACAQPNLTASWVSTVHAMGWRLLPLYVGLQAPCNSGTFGTSVIIASQAATQGKAAADDAASSMASLGLPGGSPVYFDMESYDNTNTSCRSAVLSFLSAWTTELHAKGYTSGVYSSASTGITDLVGKWGTAGFAEPDDIWFARWNGVATTTPDSYIPNSYWANHQRVHQYAGNVTQTYGGVTINIDQNAVDAAATGASRYYFSGVAPARVFDSGVTPSVGSTAVAVQVAGRGGVPANATAVVVNTEVFGPTAAGYVRVTPYSQDAGVAVQEFAKGQAVSNLAVVPLVNGKVQVKVVGGKARILMDVSGYFSATGAGFTGLAPARVFDSGVTPSVGSTAVAVQVAGRGGVPANATAVVVNTEVFGPTAAGYVRVTPYSQDAGVAVQEFAKGQAVSNLAVVPLVNGKVQVKVSAGKARILMDVSGYFTG